MRGPYPLTSSNPPPYPANQREIYLLCSSPECPYLVDSPILKRSPHLPSYCCFKCDKQNESGYQGHDHSWHHNRHCNMARLPEGATAIRSGNPEAIWTTKGGELRIVKESVRRLRRQQTLFVR